MGLLEILEDHEIMSDNLCVLRVKIPPFHVLLSKAGIDEAMLMSLPRGTVPEVPRVGLERGSEKKHTRLGIISRKWNEKDHTE